MTFGAGRIPASDTVMRKRFPFFLAALAASLIPAAAPWAAPPSGTALAEAARKAKLATIDPSGEGEYGDMTVEDWLTGLSRGRVRGVAWTGGRCRLVIPENPTDAGGAGARCGRAVIRLAEPRGPDDRPEIEIYFNLPKPGQALEAYAFRGVIESKDGREYTRFTRDFEAVWRERFGAE